MTTLLLLLACKPDAGLTKYNSVPEAQITAPADGAGVLSGTAVTLRGAASDANHDAAELLARWFVDDTEVCASAPPAADGTTTCEVVVPDASSMAVRLEVSDPDGAAGAAYATYAVSPNADPVATIQSPLGDGVYYADQLVTFRGEVSDAEDDAAALTVWWEDGDTRIEGVNTTPTSSGEVLGYALLAEGAHAIELHVLDTAGNESIASVLVEVGPPNSAPGCGITAPVDGSAGASGATVTFRGTVSDPDISPDLLAVTWSSDKDGVIGTSTPTSGGTVTFPYADLSTDTHVVTMQVVDELGATCAAEVVYTVGSPPEILLETPLPGEVVNEGEVLSFSALVSDGEDVPGDLWVTWESDLDGVFHEGAPDSTGAAMTIESGLSAGEHVLTVTVTDTDGLYATALGTFTVNGVPDAPGVLLEPVAPDTDDDLRVTLTRTSVDPDGDPVTYTYAWSVGGLPSSASASATLPASATRRGETWSVAVTATDGFGTSAAGTASVTIGNSAPSLSGLSLSPDPAYEDDILTCAAGTLADADGDTVGLTYEWYVDGVALGLDTDTLTGASFDRGDAVTCSATPSDGTDDGGLVTSNTVTIGNSAPDVASVSITPLAPSSSSTLTCAYAGYSDADGDADASTIEWSVGGVVVGTGGTLAGAFVGGDVVTCTVTPYDGTDAGVSVSSSVTVENTGPALGTVNISPASATNDDVLTCSATATDADGGTPTLGYAWTDDTRGTSLGTGATLALTSALAGSLDTITCTVTATDGAGAADVGSASIVLDNRAPEATATLTPGSPTRASTLTCGGTASDADDDGTALSFAWTVDGAGVAASGGTSTSSTLAGVFEAGQVVACSVSAADGKGGTDTDVASVVVGNVAPVVSRVSLSPATVYTDDTLTASVSASDADGDGLTTAYEWYVDGALVQSGPDNTLSGVAYFDRDQVVTVTATVSDGSDTDAATSGAVTVSNTAPEAPTVQITPAGASRGDDLTCELVSAATDADGDPVTYAFAWDVDGASYGDATDAASSSRVDGADVGGAETWTCEVTASDGDAFSTVATASITTGLGCDVDMDGYLSTDSACGGDDCDDGDASVNPAATEVCDGVDNDCDGTTDGVYATYDFDGGISSSWMVTNGDARSAFSGSDGYLQLTSTSSSNRGTAWFVERMDATRFEVDFSFHIHSGSGADGLTFAWLNETSTSALGPSGGYFGVQGLSGYAVEFDTYYNSEWDPNENHVAIIDPASFATYASSTAIPELEDTGWHDATITMESGTVSVYVDGTLYLTYTLPSYTMTDAMMGFTAGTGGLTNYHDVDDVAFVCP